MFNQGRINKPRHNCKRFFWWSLQSHFKRSQYERARKKMFGKFLLYFQWVFFFHSYFYCFRQDKQKAWLSQFRVWLQKAKNKIKMNNKT